MPTGPTPGAPASRGSSPRSSPSSSAMGTRDLSFGAGGEPAQLSGALQHVVQHSRRELAGKGVLLADVEAVDHVSPVWQVDHVPVAESGSGPHAQQVGEDLVGELAEGDEDPHLREEGELAIEVRAAAI